MKYTFWVSVAVVAYAYVGYPAIMLVMARVWPHRWCRSPKKTMVSIVMAVHNGAPLLGDKIDHLAALEPHLVSQIIIISDGSSDSTAQILSQLSDLRFHSIILPDQCGKAAALNHGLAIATGEILLFVDIRPRIATGALAELLSNFADPEVGCVAGELKLAGAGQDAATGAVSGMYWRYEEWIRKCEALWDSPVGVYGGFYAVRRSLVTPFPPGLILDDMFQPLAIIRQGYRSVLDSNACAVDCWPGKAAGEFHRKVRTLAGNYQLLALAPWILSFRNRVLFQLVSHKFLRLLVPYLFVWMLVSSSRLATQSILWMGVAGVQSLFWLVAALALCMPMPFNRRLISTGSALLLLNAAAVGGLYKFLFAPRPLWKMWTPTAEQQKSTLRAV